MNKKDRQEYKEKLRYISEHSKCIDYDWFDSKGLIIWIDDLQKTKNVYYVGYFAMDRDGKFYIWAHTDPLHFPVEFWDQENCRVKKNLPFRKYDYDNPTMDSNIDWLFKNVSVNSMLWRVNRIYDELKSLKPCSH